MVLAGEELCTVSATDKHTGMCHKDGRTGVQRAGGSNSFEPAYSYLCVMHAHMSRSVLKWDLTKGFAVHQAVREPILAYISGLYSQTTKQASGVKSILPCSVAILQISAASGKKKV